MFVTVNGIVIHNNGRAFCNSLGFNIRFPTAYDVTLLMEEKLFTLVVSSDDGVLSSCLTKLGSITTANTTHMFRISTNLQTMQILSNNSNNNIYIRQNLNEYPGSFLSCGLDLLV